MTATLADTVAYVFTATFKAAVASSFDAAYKRCRHG